MNDVEKIKAVVANRPKAEKMAWRRKQDKLLKIVQEQIHPIEQKITELIAEKDKIYENEVVPIREEMVKDCIHPAELLILKTEFEGTPNEIRYVECKFCNRKIMIREDV